MNTVKKTVFLAGASGSMGYEAFKELWKRKQRGEVNIVLLQRPSQKNIKLFKKWMRLSKCSNMDGKGVSVGDSLKIVWGDATIYDDCVEAVKAIDYLLCPMAFISPEADRNPKMAKAVNTDAIKNLIKAVENEPNGAEHIKFVYIGTVAETGDRLPPIHHGRVGDPLKPSIFDFYACTKIAGERALLESKIKHWVSLRQTFIMIPDLMSLQDPIMFHQPINSFMENNTAEDAGRGLVNCIDVPDDSDFWRRVYNMAGGPNCRITYLDFMNITYKMLGLDYRKVMERKWFALRNFHMQYFDDSWVLNEYIHNWGDTLEDYKKRVWKNFPFYMKMVAIMCRILPSFRHMVEKQTYKQLKKLAERPDGTLGWINNKNDMRISAFYSSYENFENIKGWDDAIPAGVLGTPEPEYIQLNHGYDETKEKLELADLQLVAEFRGGKLLSQSWSGDMYQTLKWKCAFNHEFEAKPYTVLKAGHWCPNCEAPPWNYDEIAKKNKFFAQIWYPNHSPEEKNFYPENCYLDISTSK